MSIVSTDRITLHSQAVDKADAIRQAGALLVETGCVMPEYVEGMLAREQSMSTSLGNGVAIPHGLLENRNHVLQTGISVLQFADGVDWEDDSKVYLVIGIAASADEHVGVLANLADVIEDDNTLNELCKTNDPQVIVNYLGIEKPAEISDLHENN